MVPIDLPLKPSEAASLADLIFQFAEGRPLNDEVRNRLAGRLNALELTSMVPYMGSLQKDPIHSSAYYVAVDATSTGEARPLLLRMALASSPVSALFPAPILIGRMRPGGGREIIVNAIPFSCSDQQNVRTFGDRIDRSFLPRPQGPQSSITVQVERPELEIPAAFDAFRAISRKYGVNLASISVTEKTSPEDVYCAALWSAIRAGWRDGYTLVLGLPGERSAPESAVKNACEYTRFSILADAEVRREPVEALFDFIQEIKSRSALTKYFDFELALSGSHSPTTAAELIGILSWLKDSNRAAQLIAPNLGDGSDLAGIIGELAAGARQFNATLSFRIPYASPQAFAQQIGRATAGRFDVRASTNGLASRGAIAEHLIALASDLRT